MKKAILFLTLLTAMPIYLSSHSTNIQMREDYQEIELWRNKNTTRSIISMPEASIRHEVLSVSFDGSGMYSLYIEDSFGTVVYQSMLPADGMEYDYDLSGIGEGLFRLILDGHDGEYEGYFTLR